MLSLRMLTLMKTVSESGAHQKWDGLGVLNFEIWDLGINCKALNEQTRNGKMSEKRLLNTNSKVWDLWKNIVCDAHKLL